MGINITDGFSLNAPKFLDSRQSFETLEEMKNCDPNLIPEGFECYVVSVKRKYRWNSDNYNDTIQYGKWREVPEGGESVLSQNFTTQVSVGQVEAGTTFVAGTSLEDVLKAIFYQKLSDDLSYWGTIDKDVDEPTVELIKALNSANIGNKRFDFVEKGTFGHLTYAYPALYGELTSMRGNGFEYVHDTFNRYIMTIDDVEYYVYFSKHASSTGAGISWVMM